MAKQKQRRVQTAHLKHPDQWEPCEWRTVYDGTQVVGKEPIRWKKKKKDVKKFIKTLSPDGEIVHVETKVKPDHLFRDHNRQIFSVSLVEGICKQIYEGQTVRSILSKLNIHPTTFYHWLKQYPNLKEMYELAKTNRADYFHDKAIETAEITQDKEDVPAAKLKVDTYKWAAEVADPKTYGKAKDQNINIPVQIILNTGIDDIEITQEPIEAEKAKSDD